MQEEMRSWGDAICFASVADSSSTSCAIVEEHIYMHVIAIALAAAVGWTNGFGGPTTMQGSPLRRTLGK